MDVQPASDLSLLQSFLKTRIEEQAIVDDLERMVQERMSTAGGSRENVLTREFLCPAIAEYFYEKAPALGLSRDQIRSGLGAEGHKHCEGFGFTPNGGRHLFHKNDVTKSTPPEEWLLTGRALTGKSPWPDFAVRKPLPLSLVGEVKLFSGSSAASAVKELYDGARQAVFYLGAFRGEYSDALLIIADATKDRVFTHGLATLKPTLLERFGPSTGIHLTALSLS